MNAKLTSNLTAIALKAPEAAKAALLQTAADVYDVSQQLVPVDTTSLKKSGGVEVESSTTVNIGYGVPGVFIDGREPSKYAGFVEYGTSEQQAQPYLTPAFTQNEETFKQRLGDELGTMLSGK